MSRPTVCLDVGSGWVKALGIDAEGEPTGCAQRTTTPHDLLECVQSAAGAVGVAPPMNPRPSAGDTQLLACSSAGGGLRLAVVCQDRLSGSEAGHRVARSAGARVVHVQAGLLEPSGVRALRSSRPDVVLLLDGLDADPDVDVEQTLLRNAARLARARVRAPIVLAVRESAREDALAVLRSTGRTVAATEAALRPDGRFVPEPARLAVAELLAAHLVGGRGSATTARFRRLAGMSTPVTVRLGVLELARGRAEPDGAVLVIDVGASTTEVYSVPPAPGDDSEPDQVLVTAEADLGMRPTSEGILIDGQAEGIVDPVEADLLAPAVRRLAEETDFLPTDPGSRAEDRRLAALASVLAARRHLRSAGPRLAGVGVGLVVLTGGVFRQPDADGLEAVRLTLRTDPVLGPVLGGCPMAVDDGFALAPAGLLAAHGRPESARTVLEMAIAPDSG